MGEMQNMCASVSPVLICYLSVGNPHSVSVSVLNSPGAYFFSPSSFYDFTFLLPMNACRLNNLADNWIIISPLLSSLIDCQRFIAYNFSLKPSLVHTRKFCLHCQGV